VNEIQRAIHESRRDLLTFTRWMFWKQRRQDWVTNFHHRIICDALMDVVRGKTKRLIINIPPRYSKTALIQHFVSWTLGLFPDSEYIYTSYSGTLAEDNSWQTRDLVGSEGFREIFPDVLIRADASRRDNWRTTNGGSIYAAGTGGAITGFGGGKERSGFGGALIIDDPHKPDEVRSDVVRTKVIDWFQNTFESRKNSPERTPIILIMQRLHEEDLAGWLLNGGNGEKWDHICLPAIQDDGTALWPAKHPIEALRRMEQASPYTFAGQYMQRPSPAEGGLFKPDRIEVVDAVPYGQIEWVRGWDLASVTNGGDWTAGGKLGRLPDGRFLIADMVRVQEGPDTRDAIMLNTAKRDTFQVKVDIPQDPGQAGKTQVAYLTRQFAGFNIVSSPESGDKVTRAEPFAAQVNVGNVLMLRGPWNDALLDEMRMFPNGAYDDQIDSLSRAFAGLINSTDLEIWAKLGT